MALFVKSSCKNIRAENELHGNDLIVSQLLSTTDNLEDKSVYDLARWASFKIKKHVLDCDACTSCLTTPNPVLPESSLTTFKSCGGLTHPSKELFQLIKHTENVFRQHDISKANVVRTLVHEIMKTSLAAELSTKCSVHNVTERVLHRYVQLRMHIRAAFITQHLTKGDTGDHGSKSAKARTTVL